MFSEAGDERTETAAQDLRRPDHGVQADGDAGDQGDPF
jgi:hypothetical protein